MHSVLKDIELKEYFGNTVIKIVQKPTGMFNKTSIINGLVICDSQISVTLLQITLQQVLFILEELTDHWKCLNGLK